MSSETLRELSRTYAAGDLDRESYRVKRRELIERIVAGEAPVVAWRAPEPEAPTVFPYDEDDGDTTQEIMPAVATAAGADEARGFPWLTVLVTLAVVAAVAWGALQWLARDDGGEPPAVPVPAVIEKDLLERFLADNSWTSASLAALRRAYDDLAPDGRAALAGSDSLRRMGDALLRQIGSERALLGIGDAEEALDAQAELLDLAEHLGITDERFRRAREVWVDAREEHLGIAGERAPEMPFEPDVAPAVQEPPAADEAVPQEPETDAEEAEPVAEDVVEPPEAADEAAADAPSAEAPAATAPAEPAAATRAAVTAAPAAAAVTAPAKASSRRSNCKAELARERRPYCIDIMDSGIKGPVLVVLPPGEFTMGGEQAQEQPRHTVRIDYPLAIGMFEISGAELASWCRHAGRDCPAQPWNDPALPAVNVSWQTARDYAAWLSEVTGARYRLPSEAEWEYAARAGTTTPYPFGDELLPTHARFSFRGAEERPLAANDRTINRNDFRLYHMVGNVREWVEDTWFEDYHGAHGNGSARIVGNAGPRVVRGGSYADGADALRSAARTSLDASASDVYTGFRVVRAIEN